jgi:hypothetical protein
MVSLTKASILCFPQRYEANQIFLNILFVPREDPLQPFTTNVPAGVTIQPFASAQLKFAARFIPSPEFLPAPANAGNPISLTTTPPVDAENLIQELKTIFNITLPSNELKPHPSHNTFIRKYLPVSYRNAFDFSHPRSPKYGVVDDAYLCAMKKPPVPGPKLVATTDVSWGRVFALALRQPELAKRLGMLYNTQVTIPASDYFKDGGWLYIELSDQSDFYQQALASPTLIKRYAARIPKLSGKRSLFAPVQFLVSDTPQAGNADTLFLEAAAFDDGFANIVHCAQPQKANLILEPGQEGLSPIKDFGIRIGWEDEQILEWYNRLMRRPDHVPPLIPTPGNELIDAPVGILSYRIDVRNINSPANKWYSLNKAKGQLKVGTISLGLFNDELGNEVVPTQMDGLIDGVRWLPSYFAQWNGNSAVLRDEKAAELFGLNGTLKQFQPIDIDKIPLRYGETYEFRIRMADMTGGGPKETDSPVAKIPSQTASCRFRRFVPPGLVRIPSLDNAAPAAGDPVDPPNSYSIYRPLLGYPAFVYTGYQNAFDLLKADAASALVERREPAYADPDVASLKIEVAVQGLEMDTALSTDKTSSFYNLYTTFRNFPDNQTDPLELAVTFTDSPILQFGDPANLGDLPLPQEAGPIVLPTGRTIKITVTPICKPDATLSYFGNDVVRSGRPTEIFTRAKIIDETLPLFYEDISAKQLKGILLQPDEQPDKHLEAQVNGAGKKGESAQTLMSRLANTLDLDSRGLSLTAKLGQRVIFGCCKEIRHTLSPEHNSITFSSKADLINHWIPALTLTLNRDWSWDGLKDKSLTIKRNGKIVGEVEVTRVVNDIALDNPDRNKTTIIFLDAVDPKPLNDKLPNELALQYDVEINLIDPPLNNPPLEININLPIAVKPAQLPKIVSAGIALSPYERDQQYSRSKQRRKMLWIEFEEALYDKRDNYFVFVKSYAPDPLLISSQQPIEDPKEDSPYVDPEPIRVIVPDQPKDWSGLNAMQQMIPSDSSPNHFLVPLPPGISESSSELFGFFVYEICVGHAIQWSTAQARFGRSVRLSGVKHPAPSLVCSVARDNNGITVSGPHATAVHKGENLSVPPATELWGLLYAQVKLVDGKDYRNVLLGRMKMFAERRYHEFDYTLSTSFCQWTTPQVASMLEHWGISSDADLSCMVVEVFPNAELDPDPLGGDLGFTRIYRTSQLEPVPSICCVDCP